LHSCCGFDPKFLLAKRLVKDYITRSISPKDIPFLLEMLYHAIYVQPGDAPPLWEVILDPQLSRYVVDWGRMGDFGFVALENHSGQPIGAAWARLLVGNNQGYGYVNDEIPEISLAVLPQQRGKGVGTLLLTRLLEEAQVHYEAVSLSVSPQNPAIRLYHRLGFEVVSMEGDSITMILYLVDG
jgi:ribosomal protein S18 acetylase RimI-like enzyme